jgi:hypothetical protein
VQDHRDELVADRVAQAGDDAVQLRVAHAASRRLRQ